MTVRADDRQVADACIQAGRNRTGKGIGGKEAMLVDQCHGGLGKRAKEHGTVTPDFMVHAQLLAGAQNFLVLISILPYRVELQR